MECLTLTIGFGVCNKICFNYFYDNEAWVNQLVAGFPAEQFSTDSHMEENKGIQPIYIRQFPKLGQIVPL